MRAAFALALGAALLAGMTDGRSAGSAAPACRGAQRHRMVAELLFGRDIGRRLGVSETAWANFVAREIVPRFPDGLTIIDARGSWRDRASGRIVRERSKKVEIVLPGKADDQARIDAIAAAYKRRFHQQSVGIVIQDACVAF